MRGPSTCHRGPAWLTAKLKSITEAGEQLERVFHEQITFVGKNGVDTLHAHGKQLGTVERWCALKRVPDPEGIRWDDAKKFVTGQRSASSDLVLKTIQKRFPDVTDHNQASAVAVMLTAQNKFPVQPVSRPPHAGTSGSEADPG